MTVMSYRSNLTSWSAAVNVLIRDLLSLTHHSSAIYIYISNKRLKEAIMQIYKML